MQRHSTRLTISALALGAMLGALAPAYAGGGGNMNPAGSDPQASGQSSEGTGEASRASGADTSEHKSSYGTGEASRASSADTKEEKKELPGSGMSEKKAE